MTRQANDPLRTVTKATNFPTLFPSSSTDLHRQILTKPKKYTSGRRCFLGKSKVPSFVPFEPSWVMPLGTTQIKFPPKVYTFGLHKASYQESGNESAKSLRGLSHSSPFDLSAHVAGIGLISADVNRAFPFECHLITERYLLKSDSCPHREIGSSDDVNQTFPV